MASQQNAGEVVADAVLQHHHVVAGARRVDQRGQHALVGVHPGEQHRGDAEVPQHRVQLGVPEAAHPVLVDLQSASGRPASSSTTARRPAAALQHRRAGRHARADADAGAVRVVHVQDAGGRLARSGRLPQLSHTTGTPAARSAGSSASERFDRPRGGRHVDADRGQPAVGVAEVVLHVDHHDGRPRQVHRDRARFGRDGDGATVALRTAEVDGRRRPRAIPRAADPMLPCGAYRRDHRPARYDRPFRRRFGTENNADGGRRATARNSSPSDSVGYAAARRRDKEREWQWWSACGAGPTLASLLAVVAIVAAARRGGRTATVTRAAVTEPVQPAGVRVAGQRRDRAHRQLADDLPDRSERLLRRPARRHRSRRVNSTIDNN